MRILRTIEFAADPAQVYAMVVDPDFHERKCAATGAVEYWVEVTERGNGIHTRRLVPTRRFPDFVRGMIGEHLEITDSYSWGQPDADGSRWGRLTVGVGELPGGMTATVRLRPGGTGTQVTYDGQLKARVPLIGGRIEKAAAPAIESAIRIEHEVGQVWLAEGDA